MTLVRRERLKRRKADAIVWVVDDDGDMKPGDTEGDKDNDCYVVDYDGDGRVDRLVDYLDNNGDGKADEMEIRYFVRRPVAHGVVQPPTSTATGTCGSIGPLRVSAGQLSRATTPNTLIPTTTRNMEIYRQRLRPPTHRRVVPRERVPVSPVTTPTPTASRRSSCVRARGRSASPYPPGDNGPANDVGYCNGRDTSTPRCEHRRG